MSRLGDFVAAAEPRRRKAWVRHLAQRHTDLPGLEALLSALPVVAWSQLLGSVLRQIDRRDPMRGWRQAQDLFNEARAYLHLQQAGCTEIAFIASDMTARSPDICARQGERNVFCEVKSLHFTDVTLTPLAKKKLRMRCDDGLAQLAAAMAAGDVGMLYLVIDADAVLVHEIRLFLKGQPPAGVEIVIDALN